jgi:hypothetical protein
MQQRQLNAFLNGGETLSVNHHPALIVQPPAKCRYDDEGHEYDYDFHLGALLSTLNTLVPLAGLHRRTRNIVATGRDLREYEWS